MYNTIDDVCIEVKDLMFSYDRKSKNVQKTEHVLDGISCSIKKNKITTLIGGNGSGKTTFFNLITKNLKTNHGTIIVDGKKVEEYGQKEYAKKVAIVHQNNTASHDITVENLVGYGRTPYITIFNPMTTRDKEIVDWALKVTDLTDLKKRKVMSLSGGQRQRVWIAMALAQKTEILLLDEPTTYLDIRYQIELLEMIQKINRDYGITIIMVLHDMNHAIYYSDVIIGMRNGKIIVDGPSKEVMNSSIINKIYGIDLNVMNVEGGKIVIPVRQ